MPLLNFIGDFLLSEWLWSMTIGWSFLPINVIIMTLLARQKLQIRFTRAASLVISAHLFSMIVFAAVIAGILVYILDWRYVPVHYEVVHWPFMINLCIAMVYLIFQGLFFKIVESWSLVGTRAWIHVAALSSLLAATISYGYIRLSMFYIF